MENQTKWTELLQAAVIEPGPINSYPGWQKLNRQVRKGEKAIYLCMPLTRKKENDAGEKETVITNFIWKPHWFVLKQTEGEPIEPIASPAWDKGKALATLGIEEIAFTLTDGNVQGSDRWQSHQSQRCPTKHCFMNLLTSS